MLVYSIHLVFFISAVVCKIANQPYQTAPLTIKSRAPMAPYPSNPGCAWRTNALTIAEQVQKQLGTGDDEQPRF